MEGKRILVGVTGGIAAYKVPQLVRLLKKRGADVRIVCTPAALHFVGDETLRAISGHPVYRDGAFQADVEHVRLAEWTDLFLICPATANTIAKIAHGIADNLLTTLALAVPPGKIAVVPAMNTVMWRSAVTSGNCRLLERRGTAVLPVGRGELATRKVGAGRMLEPAEIVDLLTARMQGNALLKGRRVLISSGPTEEPLDPVRVITNRSSGKMGAALAAAALAGGARVTVVSGPASEPLPAGARVVRVTTASEMRGALLKAFRSADICIMAAAVSDFRPVKIRATKIRRRGAGRLSLEFAATSDILAELGRIKGARFLAGFALETGAGETAAKRKMKEKQCDLMILNRVGDALGGDTTRMTVFDASGGAKRFPPMDKTRAAFLILQRIAALTGSKRRG